MKQKIKKILPPFLIFATYLNASLPFLSEIYGNHPESNPDYIASKNLFFSSSCYSGKLKSIFGNCVCPSKFIVDPETEECLPNEKWFFSTSSNDSSNTESSETLLDNNSTLTKTMYVVIGGGKDRPTRVFDRIDTIPSDLRKKVPATALAKDPASPTSDCYNPDNPEDECYSGPGGPYYATPDLVALEEDPTDANITEYITDDGNETGISVMISVPANEKVIKSVSLSNTILKKLKEKNIGEKQIDRKLRLIRSLLEKVEIIEEPAKTETSGNDLSWATGVLTRAELNKLVYLWEQEKTNREYISLLENANVSAIEDFSYLFYDKPDFNINISSWDVSNGKDFSYMFTYASSFNQDISSWDVSKGETFEGMFAWASAFDVDVSGWAIQEDANINWMFYPDENENQKFKDVLKNKCNLDDSLFDETTQTYNGDLDCSGKNLTDSDLYTFIPLKKIKGSLLLNNNNLTSLHGLENLEEIEGQTSETYIDISRNPITDISAIQGLKKVSSLDLDEDGYTVVGMFLRDTNIDNIIYLKDIDFFKTVREGEDYHVFAFNKNNYSKIPNLNTTFCKGLFEDEDRELYYGSYWSYLPLSSICSYSTEDKFEKFLYKCDIPFSEKTKLDTTSGVFNGSIDCYQKNLNSDDLLGLEDIKKITGGLDLRYNNLTNLEGLKNLEYVGDPEKYSYLTISHNKLNNIEGLLSLKAVFGEFDIGDNNLTSLNGLQNLQQVYSRYRGVSFSIKNNPYLSDISALSSLSEITSLAPSYSNVKFEITDTNISDLSPIENISLNDLSKRVVLYADNKNYLQKAKADGAFCKSLEESTASLSVVDSSYTSFSRLKVCDLDTNDTFVKTIVLKCNMELNDVINNWNRDTGVYTGSINCANKGLTDTDLATFSTLRKITGQLDLSQNNFTNLSGLSNLEEVQELRINDIEALTDIDDIKNIKVSLLSLANNSIFDMSPILSMSFFEGDPYIDLSGNSITYIPSLPSILNYGLNLSNNNISDISGLSNTIKTKTLNLSNNQISSLSYMSNIETIEGSLLLKNNQLKNLSGLENLKTINSKEKITYLDLSGNYDLNNTEALTNLTEIKTSSTDLYAKIKIDIRNTNIDDLSSFENISLFVGSYLKLVSISIDKDFNKKAEITKPFCSSLANAGYYAGVRNDLNQKLEITKVCSAKENSLTDIFLNKCQMSANIISTYWHPEEGVFNGSIYCGYKNINSDDLLKFKDLKVVTGSLYLDHNQIDNLSGLKYLATVKGLYLNDNNLTTLAPMEYIRSISGALDLSNNNLTDLAGLEYIDGITSNFYEIKIDLSNNPKLNSLTYLQNLKEINNTYGDYGKITINIQNTGIKDISPIEDLSLKTGTQGRISLYIDNNKTIEKKATISKNFCRDLATGEKHGYGVVDIEQDVDLPLEKVCRFDEDDTLGATLTNLCDISFTELAESWNFETGVYTGILDCSYMEITSDDLENFTPLKEVTKGIYLSGNELENIDGLRNLEKAGDFLYLDENYIENINGLSSLTEVGYLDLQYNNLTSLDGLSINKLRGKSYEAGINLESNPNLTDISALSSISLIDSEYPYAGKSAILNIIDTNVSDISALSNIEFKEVKSLLLADKKEYLTKAKGDGILCQDLLNSKVNNPIYSNYGDYFPNINEVCDFNITALKEMLIYKCDMPAKDIIAAPWDPSTGTYTGDILCSNKGITGDDIQKAFVNIKRINGNIKLDHNIIDTLEGMMSLETVKISDSGVFDLSDNNLTNLNGLNNLKDTLSLRFDNNPGLSDISALSNLRTIYLPWTISFKNTDVKDLKDLENLEGYGSALFVYVDEQIKKDLNNTLLVTTPFCAGLERAINTDSYAEKASESSNSEVFENLCGFQSELADVLYKKCSDKEWKQSFYPNFARLWNEETKSYGWVDESQTESFDSGITVSCSNITDSDLKALSTINKIYGLSLSGSPSSLNNLEINVLNKLKLNLTNTDLTGIEKTAARILELNVSNISNFSAIKDITLRNPYSFQEPIEIILTGSGSLDFSTIEDLSIPKDIPTKIAVSDDITINKKTPYNSTLCSDLRYNNTLDIYSGNKVVDYYCMTKTEGQIIADDDPTFKAAVTENCYYNNGSGLSKITDDVFDSHWDESTGTYNDSLYCSEMEDRDLDKFDDLINLDGDLYIYSNHFTNLDGLSNLKTVTKAIYILGSENTLDDIYGLTHIESAGAVVINSQYIDTKDPKVFGERLPESGYLCKESVLSTTYHPLEAMCDPDVITATYDE